MSMFDWNADDGSSVLTPRFWIFWAIAAPLTLLIIIGWFVWFYQERSLFQAQLRQVKESLQKKEHINTDHFRPNILSSLKSRLPKRTEGVVVSQSSGNSRV